MELGSQYVVAIFGVAVFALSLWGFFAPGRLIRLVRGVVAQEWGIAVAVAVRIVLGVALILAAAGSKFPFAFQIFGWITILAAAGLAVGGRKLMQRITQWFDRLSPAFVRAWVLLGLAFGAFLVYGVFPIG